MSARSLLAALLVLSLLAGCSGAPDADSSPTADGPSGRTPTGQATTAESSAGTAATEAEATETPGAERRTGGVLPPGVDESGVTNATTLAAAHHETVLRLGFVATSAEWKNGTVLGNRTMTARWAVGPDGRTLSADGTTVTTAQPPGGSPLSPRYREVIWRDETTVYRATTPNRTVYANRADRTFTAAATEVAEFERYFDAGNYSVASVEARGEHTFTTLVTSVAPDETRPGADVAVAARFVVDERGVVHEAVVEAGDGGNVGAGDRLRAEWTLVDLGVSPGRPAWVDAAPDAAFLETTLGGRVTGLTGAREPTVLAVTNEGPDAVPEGATLNVTAGRGDESHTRELRLDAALRPDATMYVYRGDDGPALTRDASVAADGGGLGTRVRCTLTAESVELWSFTRRWS